MMEFEGFPENSEQFRLINRLYDSVDAKDNAGFQLNFKSLLESTKEYSIEDVFYGYEPNIMDVCAEKGTAEQMTTLIEAQMLPEVWTLMNSMYHSKEMFDVVQPFCSFVQWEIGEDEIFNLYEAVISHGDIYFFKEIVMNRDKIGFPTEHAAFITRWVADRGNDWVAILKSQDLIPAYTARELNKLK